MQEERTPKTGQIMDLSPEVARPRLIAILFCDWVNETADGKSNLIGTFDHIIVGPGSRLTPPFTLFIRLAQVQDSAINIRVIEPNGTVGIEALVQPESVTPTEGEPVYIQAIARMQFKVDQEGIYWFDVSSQGQSLGGAPLVVRFREATDAGLSAETSISESSGRTEGEADRAHVISLLAMRGDPPVSTASGWRATIGIFADDPIMDRIIQAGRRIRESERHE